jgi:hypothetical protein
MDGSPLTAQAYGLDGQALKAPGKRPIEERVEQQLAARHRTLDPVPPPPQMHDVGQRGSREAPLMVDELASKHGDEHDADEVRGARGQSANQGVHSTSGQVNWGRGQLTRGIGWFRHPPSISNLWPLLLPIW